MFYVWACGFGVFYRCTYSLLAVCVFDCWLVYLQFGCCLAFAFGLWLLTGVCGVVFGGLLVI